MLFYLRDETVVGMIFWNMPPVDDRYMAATEVSTEQSKTGSYESKTWFEVL